MNLYLDTSSLFKLYYKEADSHQVEEILVVNKVETIFLSEITKIEFVSSVWKKVRTKEIGIPEAVSLLNAFEKDASTYSFLPIDSNIVDRSKQLFAKYGEAGLRTFDSVQLATAILLKSEVDLFKTADNLLDSFFKAEHLPT